MDVGDRQPHRCVERCRGKRRAIAIVSIATSRNATKMTAAETTNIAASRPIVGGDDRQRRERRDDQRRRDDVAASRPGPLGGDLVAKQHRDRNIVRAAERPQRKGQRGQQAVHDRQHQRRRMQSGRDRKRNDAAEHPTIANGSAAPRPAPISVANSATSTICEQ